jgi:hypothetical protein
LLHHSQVYDPDERIIREGDTLNLAGPRWAGYRQRPPHRILRVATCISVHDIVLEFSPATKAVTAIECPFLAPQVTVRRT